jgi:hypothetical protein
MRGLSGSKGLWAARRGSLPSNSRAQGPKGQSFKFKMRRNSWMTRTKRKPFRTNP